MIGHQSISSKYGLNQEQIATESILTILNLVSATNSDIKNHQKLAERKSTKSKMASKMTSVREKFQGKI